MDKKEFKYCSSLNLEHLNAGGTLRGGNGFLYRFKGKELHISNEDVKTPFKPCGDMRADDFILLLICAAHV